MEYQSVNTPAYSPPPIASNPLRLAELRLAPTFAHIVAFSITYELVAALCSRTFTGALFLLCPSFVMVAAFGDAELFLVDAVEACTGTLLRSAVRLLLWATKLSVKISVLLTANLVARLVTEAMHQMNVTHAIVFVLYILLLGYGAGRASGAIT